MCMYVFIYMVGERDGSFDWYSFWVLDFVQKLGRAAEITMKLLVGIYY